jgi:hypothetical protein
VTTLKGFARQGDAPILSPVLSNVVLQCGPESLYLVGRERLSPELRSPRPEDEEVVVLLTAVDRYYGAQVLEED